MKYLLSVIFIIFSLHAYDDACVVENTIISLKDFTSDFRQMTNGDRISQLVEKADTGNFRGVDGARLKYANFIHPKPKGTIVLLQGFTESYEKWLETILDLYDRGYSVYTFDFRGQGRSSRLGPEKDIVHVDDFNDYVKDLKIFMNNIVVPKKHDKLFMMGHSLGATIGTKYLQKHKGVFDAALMTAPMYAPRTVIPGPLAWGITEAAERFGNGDKAALGQMKFDPNQTLEKAMGVSLSTHSKERFSRYYEFQKQNPEIVTARASNSWVNTTLENVEKIRKNARKIDTPMLMFQSGIDRYTGNWGTNRVCDRAKNCEKKMFSNSFHEIFNETDNIRDEALNATDDYFSKFIKG